MFFRNTSEHLDRIEQLLNSHTNNDDEGKKCTDRHFDNINQLMQSIITMIDEGFEKRFDDEEK